MAAFLILCLSFVLFLIWGPLAFLKWLGSRVMRKKNITHQEYKQIIEDTSDKKPEIFEQLLKGHQI